MEHHRGLEERVLNHDKQLVKVETILERVADNQDKMTVSLSDIASTLAKMNTLEESTKDSFKRLHSRIDVLIEEREDEANKTKDKFEKLSIVFTVLRYPRGAVLSVIGLYFLTISDFRAMLISMVKMFG